MPKTSAKERLLPQKLRSAKHETAKMHCKESFLLVNQDSIPMDTLLLFGQRQIARQRWPIIKALKFGEPEKSALRVTNKQPSKSNVHDNVMRFWKPI